MEQALNEQMERPRFSIDNAALIGKLYANAVKAEKTAFDKARDRLISLGIIARRPGRAVVLKPILKENGRKSDRMTSYEKKMLQGLNATTLGSLFFPGVITNTPKRNYVDRRIVALKSWRDVYHYNETGNLKGWTRYGGKRKRHFNADGFIVLERDSLGRCIEARKVVYRRVPLQRDAKGRITGYDDKALTFHTGKEIAYYDYDGPNDDKGRIRVP